MPLSNNIDIELRHLRYFVTVAEELHFGRAAKRLHITQPTLSRQIRDLEEQLEVTLLKRTKRNVELSAAGKYLYEKSVELQTMVEHITIETKSIQKGYSGELSIGFTAASLHLVVAPVLRKFKEQFKGVSINMEEMTSGEQIERLQAGRLDLAFPHTHKESASLESCILVREKLGVVLPVDHLLTEEKSLTLSKFKNEDWILFPRLKNPEFYDSIIKHFVESGYSPKIVKEITPRQNAVSLVTAGFGITLLSESLSFYCQKSRGSVFRKLEGKPPEITHHMISKTEGMSAPVKHFTNLAKQIFC